VVGTVSVSLPSSAVRLRHCEHLYLVPAKQVTPSNGCVRERDISQLLASKPGSAVLLAEWYPYFSSFLGGLIGDATQHSVTGPHILAPAIEVVQKY
jgi:hypothetical protein